MSRSVSSTHGSRFSLPGTRAGWSGFFSVHGWSSVSLGSGCVGSMIGGRGGISHLDERVLSQLLLDPVEGSDGRGCLLLGAVQLLQQGGPGLGDEALRGPL